MDRRRFLAGVAAVAAMPALPIPAKAAVMPPAASITTVGARMGNVFLTPEIVAAEALRILKANLYQASLDAHFGGVGAVRINHDGSSEHVTPQEFYASAGD